MKIQVAWDVTLCRLVCIITGAMKDNSATPTPQCLPAYYGVPLPFKRISSHHLTALLRQKHVWWTKWCSYYNISFMITVRKPSIETSWVSGTSQCAMSCVIKVYRNVGASNIVAISRLVTCLRRLIYFSVFTAHVTRWLDTKDISVHARLQRYSLKFRNLNMWKSGGMFAKICLVPFASHFINWLIECLFVFGATAPGGL
jgi:hypothetical protein